MGLIHFFFPHKRNNYRALLLKIPALSSYPILLLAFFLSLSTFTNLRPGILGVISQIESKSVIEETNRSREQNGARVLRENPKLSEAAQKKAQDMIEKGYWAHIAPNGRTPWDFIRESGYTYTTAGENLARDFSDVPSMVSAWLASPSHKDNLLNRNFSEIGIGVAGGQVGGRPTIFVVQMFATPTPGTSLAQATPPPAPKVEEKGVAIAQKLEPEVEVTPSPIASSTPSPTPPPTGGPTPQIAQEREVVDVAKVAQASPRVDYFAAQKVISTSLIGLLIVLFMIDFAFVRSRRLAHGGGHPFFHLVFLVLTLVLIWYSQTGIVL